MWLLNFKSNNLIKLIQAVHVQSQNTVLFHILQARNQLIPCIYTKQLHMIYC